MLVRVAVFHLQRYLWAISMAKDEGRQVNCKAVLPIDVAKDCCNVKDVQSSFMKLMDIVIPGTLVCSSPVCGGLQLVIMPKTAYIVTYFATAAIVVTMPTAAIVVAMPTVVYPLACANTVGSVGDLAAADRKWLSSLESTKWLEHVK